MEPNLRFIKQDGIWKQVDRSLYVASGRSVPSVYTNGDGELGYASCVGCVTDGPTWVEEVRKQFFSATPPTSLDETSHSDIVSATILERGKVYGDPYESHKNIGKAWTALLNQHFGITLEHDIPPSLVAQMMVNFKMQRSARVYKDDNYIDAHAYTKFADEFQKKEQAGG